MKKEIEEVFYNSRKKRLLIVYVDKTTEKITGEKAQIKYKELCDE
jgi:uncharacterized protein YlbG (UPF0298 family)